MTITEEFLQWVLPWNDGTFKGIWVRDPKKPPKEQFFGKATKDLAEAVRMALFFDGLGMDVYVALGTQREALPARPGRKWLRSLRTVNNVVTLSSLFVDVDVNIDGKKPQAYATQADALAALVTFCNDINIPVPSIQVDSGSGGIHAYWVFDRVVPLSEWLPLGHALANAARRHNLRCDAECTKDAARILRIPGTHNVKRDVPGLVQMGKPGVRYPVEALSKPLEPYALRLVASNPQPGPRLNDDLGTRGASIPIDLTEVANAGCGLFFDMIATEGKTLTGQPLWNQLMLGCTFDVDPVSMAHGMSRQNKDYTFGSCQDMIERKLRERQERNIGWPHCDVFHQVGAPQCKTCPHLAAGKTPFHLALKKREETALNDPSLLPFKFVREPDSGFIKGCGRFAGAKGEEVWGYVMRQKAYDAGIWENKDGRHLVFKSEPDGKPRLIVVPQSVIHSAPETAKALNSQGVIIDGPAQNMAREFMASWSEQLQRLKQTVVPDALGWNDKLAFAYGDSVYEPGGTKPAFYGEDDIVKLYTPRGELAEWKLAAKMIVSLKRPELEVIIATAFAAPLVKFASGEAVLLSVYSRESGIGKTTAMKIGQAVWGHPVKGMNGLDDTENALMKKVSDLGNLPLYWDEIKTKGQYEKLVSIAFSLGQGKNKARLTRDIRAAEIRSFSTMFIGASNDSLVNVILRGTKGTAAGVYRVFELVVPGPTQASPYSLTQMQTAVQDLIDSHGHAGRVYAETLGSYGPGMKRMVKDMQLDLEREFTIKPEERYWAATMATILVGAVMAKHLGLVDFDLPGIKQVLTGTLAMMRKRVERDVEQMKGQFDAEEMLGELLSSTRTESLLVTDTIVTTQGRPVPGSNKLHCDTTRLKDVWLQLGLQDNKLRVKAGPFRDWLHERGYNSAQVFEVLTKHYGLTDRLARIAAGTVFYSDVVDRAQARCFDIDMPMSLSTPSSPSASPGSP